MPVAGRFVAVEDDARERVMPVRKNISLDGDPIPDGALAGKPAGIDLGAYRLDGHPTPAFGALVRGGRRFEGRNADPPLDRNPSHG
jgi:hypothetical protein